MQRLVAVVAAGAAVAAAADMPDVKSHPPLVLMHAASALGPLLRLTDPETAHWLGIQVAKRGLLPGDSRADDPRLAMQLWGRSFSNPLGIAAGFDKDGEAISGLLGLGFGFMEVGAPPRPGRMNHVLGTGS